MNHVRLEELSKAMDEAEKEILHCVRMWRGYVAVREKALARRWLKKVAEAEEARSAATEAWGKEYDCQRAEERAHARPERGGSHLGFGFSFTLTTVLVVVGAGFAQRRRLPPES